MVSDIAMYELRERKQQAYNAVCSDFVVNHNIEQLAKRISLDGQSLRNMLNPAQPHKLSPVDLVLLCKASGDYTIINTLFSDCGVVAVRCQNKGTKRTSLSAYCSTPRFVGNSLVMQCKCATQSVCRAAVSAKPSRSAKPPWATWHY